MPFVNSTLFSVLFTMFLITMIWNKKYNKIFLCPEVCIYTQKSTRIWKVNLNYSKFIWFICLVFWVFVVFCWECYDMGFIMSRYVLSNGTPHLQPLFKYHDNQGVLSFNVTQTSRGPYCYDCYECLWIAIKIYIHVDIQNKYSSKWDYFWLDLLN